VLRHLLQLCSRSCLELGGKLRPCLPSSDVWYSQLHWPLCTSLPAYLISLSDVSTQRTRADAHVHMQMNNPIDKHASARVHSQPNARSTHCTGHTCMHIAALPRGPTFAHIAASPSGPTCTHCCVATWTNLHTLLRGHVDQLAHIAASPHGPTFAHIAASPHGPTFAHIAASPRGPTCTHAPAYGLPHPCRLEAQRGCVRQGSDVHIWLVKVRPAWPRRQRVGGKRARIPEQHTSKWRGRSSTAWLMNVRPYPDALLPRGIFGGRWGCTCEAAPPQHKPYVCIHTCMYICIHVKCICSIRHIYACIYACICICL